MKEYYEIEALLVCTIANGGVRPPFVVAAVAATPQASRESFPFSKFEGLIEVASKAQD